MDNAKAIATTNRCLQKTVGKYNPICLRFLIIHPPFKQKNCLVYAFEQLQTHDADVMAAFDYRCLVYVFEQLQTLQRPI